MDNSSSYMYIFKKGVYLNFRINLVTCPTVHWLIRTSFEIMKLSCFLIIKDDFLKVLKEFKKASTNRWQKKKVWSMKSSKMLLGFQIYC